MAININPVFIAGAKQFLTNGIVSQPCPLLNDAGDLRSLSMQFTFEDTLCWEVNLKQGSPNPPLNQIVSLYIDTGLSFHDAYLYVPDTGYSKIINAGDGAMMPIISNTPVPVFFLIIVPDEVSQPDDRILPLPDIINIIAFNKFIPPFSSHAAIRTLDFKYGDGFTPTPVFIMDQVFTYAFNTIEGHPLPNNPFLIIPATRWYLNTIDISVTGLTSSAAPAPFVASLYDGNPSAGGILIFSKGFILNDNYSFQQIFDFQNLNYASQRLENSGLWLSFDFGGEPFTGVTSINVTGGILAA